MKNKKTILILAFVAGILQGIAGAASVPFFSDLQTIADSLDFRMSLMGYGLYQEVKDSGINPYNILGLPKWRSQTEIRPDLYLTRNHLDFEFKPRFTAYCNIWADGIFQQEENAGESEFYVNEWIARLRITDEVFISGGRENLQWGPSILLSPSNPFYRNNGRNNPNLEMPGLDYVRAVFIPNNAWSLSLIANVGKGRDKNIFRFRNAYAAKLDFTGEEKYFSLIGSCRENENAEIGFFGGMTLSQPLLVYGEGKASAEEDAADILIGGAYTLMEGSTLFLEYFHHGSGCTRKPIERCIATQDLFQDLSDRLSDFTGTLDDLIDVIKDLELGVDGIAFARKNYLLLQYSKPRLRDVLSLTFRFIYGIDDVSARTVCLVNYEVNDHIEIFGVSNQFWGGKDTEYGSLLNQSFLLGINFMI